MNKLKYCIAENKFGKYCIPNASKHRISAKTVLKGKVWEEETVDFILSHCKNDIIHAGTYFGDMLPAFSNFENVWAFEPNEENFRCAIKTIEWNNLSNIHLTNAALSNTIGSAPLLIERNSKKLGGACQIVEQASMYTTQVKTITIDKSIPENQLISVIHLDIEEHELSALHGAVKTIKRCSPLLVLETKHKVPSNLRHFLNKQGYDNTRTLYKNVNTVWEKTQ